MHSSLDLKPRPAISVVMPVYNVERFVEQAVRSVLDQSFGDFELIIVDDGGSDASIAICRQLADHRTRIVHQANRGLAGARNTGIAEARGEFVALIDSDDAWMPEKLERHIAHLRANPDVGISYAGAKLIGDNGQPLGISQRPLLGDVTSRHVFCGQTIKNGSVPVFRRAALNEAALRIAGADRVSYFDEGLRRSEDVECWTRIALTTRWRFAGIPGDLTLYRINAAGLSADVIRQLESWDDVCAKVAAYAPAFIAAHGNEARARELRYLARRCFQIGDRGLAFGLVAEALRTWPRLVLTEPVKTLTTLAACVLLRLLPERPFAMIAGALGAPVA
jgi:glycosyltransferase involved in cell wall biosynthesis